MNGNLASCLTRWGWSRWILVGIAALGAVAGAGRSWSSRASSAASVSWTSYAADQHSSKYSPLSQINAANATRLAVAWRWDCPDNSIVKSNPALQTWFNEGTPLMIDGTLYVSTSLSQAAAIDAESGRTIWVYDPHSYESGKPTNLGFVHRGVAYWTDGKEARILYGTGDAYLIALDAKTGKPVASFGTQGRIDLTGGLRRPVRRGLYAVTSPPVICRDVVVVGSSILDYPMIKEMPPGDVRGFDVRTGRLLWTFHSIPQTDEFGAQTWEGDSAQWNGNTNVWTMMSADEELGFVYLPFSTPTNDYYGGHRHGDNLFGESLVCLDARTGRRIWHYQLIHHGIWDYDLPAAPNLVDLRVNSKRVRAVAQVTKHGYCFVFDRVTGKPIWPIEERAAPVSAVPGERASPTQPFPTRPPPFELQGATEDHLIDFTPELRAEALAILRRYHYGPLFTPPTEKGTVSLPSVVGGASWGGAACDPETGWLYVPSVNAPFVIKLTPTLMPFARYAGGFQTLFGPRGLLLFKPPFGRLTAIDLNRGVNVWSVPLGHGPRSHPALRDLNLPPLGHPARGHPLVTKTLLFVGQEDSPATRRPSEPVRAEAAIPEFVEPMFHAFDKRTGALLHSVSLPGNITGALMTYMVDGRQYLVIPTGGSGRPAELVALGLEKGN